MGRFNTKEEYTISKNRYRELKYFCLQYKEKKDKLQSMSFISAVNIDGMPHGTNISNPTAIQGEVIAQLKHDIEIIERTAMETDAEFYQYILDNITKGISWEYLDVPLSRRSFYYLRRKYFYLLSKKV